MNGIASCGRGSCSGRHNALEVVLAHGSVAIIPTQTLYAHRRVFLAGIEKLASALPAHQMHRVSFQRAMQAQGKHGWMATSAERSHLRLEFGLGLLIPRPLLFAVIATRRRHSCYLVWLPAHRFCVAFMTDQSRKPLLQDAWGAPN